MVGSVRVVAKGTLFVAFLRNYQRETTEENFGAETTEQTLESLIHVWECP